MRSDATTRVIGAIEHLSPEGVGGWCALVDEQGGYQKTRVLILVNGTQVAGDDADLDRPDVRRAGYGDGRFGFWFSMRDVPTGVSAKTLDVVEASSMLALPLSADESAAETNGMLSDGLERSAGRSLFREGLNVLAVVAADGSISSNATREADCPGTLFESLRRIRYVSISGVIKVAENLRHRYSEDIAITYLYGELLRRLPDSQGLASYSSGLRSGELEMPNIAWGMIESEEYRSRNIFFSKLTES